MFKTSIVFIMTLLSFASYANEPPKHDTSLPIKLEADKAEIDTKKGVSTYTGNVKISQGKISIQGDKLTVESTENQIGTAKVTGTPAIFSDKTNSERLVNAEAPLIEYNVVEKTLRLKNGATLNQGQNTLKGEFIDYRLDTGHVNAEGSKKKSERIEILLYPEDIKKSKDDN